MMDAKKDWIDQMAIDLRVAKARIAELERHLANEKALGDRLIVAGANALQGDPRHDRGLSDAWDMACAAYRKARGL